ncbi:MAG: methyltransferase domain-containing protein [Eggerthellaceae bacterium]|nr:methyltransferase domain-containing protein [Eggerthellaceae bacterium]
MDIPKSAADWNSLWEAKQKTRSMAHDASYWDERAKTYTNKDNPGSYTDRFFTLADIKPDDVILDMGCGTGNLTIPLAEAGHEVWAADFSSGMLQRLRDAVRERGLEEKVHVVQLSWDDDWASAGITKGQFDVCLASRSIATDDLLGALRKLDGACKRRACITLPFATSPRIDDRMLAAIGLDPHPSFDDCYTIAMLSDMGRLPELAYIPTVRNDSFPDMDDAIERYFRMACEYAKESGADASPDDIKARLIPWLKENLIPDPDDEGRLTFKAPRTSNWAFISWNKEA